jgi:hypothetical protein
LLLSSCLGWRTPGSWLPRVKRIKLTMFFNNSHYNSYIDINLTIQDPNVIRILQVEDTSIIYWRKWKSIVFFNCDS